MPTKLSLKTILAFVLLLFILISIPLAINLVKQRQEIRKKAAVPGGEATVSLSPATGTYKIGETFTASVNFNTANIPVSSIGVRITYPFSGATSELEASNIQINPNLLSTGDWSCPVKMIYPENNRIKIDIACINLSINGFSTLTDTLLATFDLIADTVPSINPTVLEFDPSESVIQGKSDNQDILLIPTSTGTYTIGPTATSTPTPTPTPIPCTSEGEVGYSLEGDECCQGLTAIVNAFPPTCAAPLDSSFVCAYCPNGECGSGENYCNCPEDCPTPTPTGVSSCTLTASPNPCDVEPGESLCTSTIEWSSSDNIDIYVYDSGWPQGHLFASSGSGGPYTQDAEWIQCTDTNTFKGIINGEVKCSVAVTAVCPPTPTPTPSCPLFAKGDANCDNSVDELDYVIWWSSYLKNLDADFNSDGKTDELDYVIWWSNYWEY